LQQNPKEIYYYIGVATNAFVPSGMYEYEIPAATWVVFENDGHFKEDVRVYLSGSTWSGCRFLDIDMRNCQILRYIRFVMDTRCTDIQRYG